MFSLLYFSCFFSSNPFCIFFFCVCVSLFSPYALLLLFLFLLVMVIFIFPFVFSLILFCLVLLCQYLYNSLHTVAGVETHCQSTQELSPPIIRTTAIKPQLYQGGPHNPHNGHSYSTQLRGSKRLHHWIPQDTHDSQDFKALL